MIRKYHKYTLQTDTQHRAEEPQSINSNKTSERQLKQNNQLSLPRQDDCKTGKGHKVMHTKSKSKTEPPLQTIGGT